MLFLLILGRNLWEPVLTGTEPLSTETYGSGFGSGCYRTAPLAWFLVPQIYLKTAPILTAAPLL